MHMQVSSLRGGFGFIRCCERPGELFFHLSEAQDSVAVGDDVEFTAARERNGERLNAVRYVLTLFVEEVSVRHCAYCTMQAPCRVQVLLLGASPSCNHDYQHAALALSMLHVAHALHKGQTRVNAATRHKGVG